MKRRNFILLSGGMFAAVAIPAGFHFFGKIKYPSSLAHPNSLAPILDLNGIKELGSAYRKQVADESSERDLAEHLLEKLPDDSSDFTAVLESMVKKDFEEGNIVEVNGWILSKTEARQCALYTFSQKPTN